MIFTDTHTDIYIYTDTHKGILLSHKQEWNNVICRKWIDLEIIIQSEVSLRRQIYDSQLIYGIWKNDTNELIYKVKQSHEQGIWASIYSYWRGTGKWWIRSLGLTDTQYYIYYKINDKNLTV